MNYIKIWCEYDISGNFGGNNNEEVFLVDGDLSEGQVDTLVIAELMTITHFSQEELEGLHGWEYINVEILKG